ncbi:MAG: hypothetical protein JWR05_3002 [Mucilaginibacter sp.]|nr:hypothetical protein [Mucilaginibacter sp.]
MKATKRKAKRIVDRSIKKKVMDKISMRVVRKRY